MLENEIVFHLGKIAVDGYYDYQEIRISQRNRIRDIIRRKIEGIPLDKPEEKKEDKTFEKKYNDKNIPSLFKQLKNESKITDWEREYLERLWQLANETEKIEKMYKMLMEQYISKEPIWYMWLSKIKGISLVLASNLIKNFGYCEKYRYVSSLWRHCGLDPEGAKGWRHGEKIHYNPRLKTLAWKIADSFVKQRTQPYRGIYDNEKQRQISLMENGAENKPQNLKHADLRARRKMVKVFLQHYFVVARTLKNLPLSKPYAFDRLGHSHYVPPPHFSHLLIEDHIINASQVKGENQKENVSHRPYENQVVFANQSTCENQCRGASQMMSENQDGVASHCVSENHDDGASHCKDENHPIVASQVNNENHTFCVSHPIHENQINFASQPKIKNQRKHASHGLFENHRGNASHLRNENHQFFASHMCIENHLRDARYWDRTEEKIK